MRKQQPAGDALNAIREQAGQLGFDAVGFCDAALPDVLAERLDRFVALGRHGEMDWMARTAVRRRHPRAMWPQARSAIVLGTNYGPSHDPLAPLARRDRATISVYAQNDDYHDVIKKRLKALGRWMAHEFDCELKVFVDTAPLLEKPLAAQAGLGWQGKHTNLVSRGFGSWLFLGIVLTTLGLPAGAPATDHCGSCRNCLDACPTDAFPAPYQLDARRCISYLTIEHPGPIPRAFRAAMGNRIYGCDDCLAVCPWNKFAVRTKEFAFRPRAELTAPRLADLAALGDADFRRVFAKSPIKRIGRNRFVRNVLIAIGNSGETRLAEVAERLLDDPDATVRGAAVWALAQLLPAADFARCRDGRLGREADETVVAEWGAG